MRPRSVRVTQHRRTASNDGRVDDLLCEIKPRNKAQTGNRRLGIVVDGNNALNRSRSDLTRLLATYLETLGESKTDRTRYGDPLVNLAKKEDMESFKTEIITKLDSFHSEGEPLKRMCPPDDSATVHGNLLTPLRRRHASPSSASQPKRKRTMTHSYNGEEDVSLDTVQSVLRLVDESLMYTPERDAIKTPRVLHATSGPSPHQNAPEYAYGRSFARALLDETPLEGRSLFWSKL